jgi:hypothetical protein
MSTLTEKEIAKIVDEMANLQRTFEPMVKKFEKLKKQLAAYVAEDETDEPIRLTSDSNYITYTKPTNYLVCKVGAEKFLEETQCFDAISVIVSVAKDQLDDELLAKLFERKRGSRRLQSITPIVETVYVFHDDEEDD